MPLFLKTVRSVWKFCQQLALEYTKLIKLGIFQELDTLDSYPTDPKLYCLEFIVSKLVREVREGKGLRKGSENFEATKVEML